MPSPFGSCAAGTPPPSAGRNAAGGKAPVAQTNSEVEPSIAVDPGNPMRIVAAWQQDRWTNAASRAVGISASDDGGATWRVSWPLFDECAGGTPGTHGGYVKVSDPWVAATVDGTFLVSVLAVNAAAQLSAIVVTRSTDGGRTWSAPLAVARDTGAAHFNDKEAITADPAVPGRAWIAWDRSGGSTDPEDAAAWATPAPAPRPSTGRTPFSADVMLVRTDDGGVTWTAPRSIFAGAPNRAMVGNQVAVLPDGTLLDVAELLTDSGLRDARTGIGVLRSTDGGRTWSEPVVVGRVTVVDVVDPRTRLAVRTGWAIPDIAVDRTTGRAYLVWADARFGGGRPGIAFASSADSGATWTAPSRVDPGIRGRAAFTPMVAVTGRGRIGVSYVVAEPAGAARDTWPTRIMLAQSGDAGQTWRPKSLSRAFDLHDAPTSPGLFLGDYSGLAEVTVGEDQRFVSVNVVTTNRGRADPTDVVVSVVRP